MIYANTYANTYTILLMTYMENLVVGNSWEFNTPLSRICCRICCGFVCYPFFQATNQLGMWFIPLDAPSPNPGHSFMWCCGPGVQWFLFEARAEKNEVADIRIDIRKFSLPPRRWDLLKSNINWSSTIKSILSHVWPIWITLNDAACRPDLLSYRFI